MDKQETARELGNMLHNTQIKKYLWIALIISLVFNVVFLIIVSYSIRSLNEIRSHMHTSGVAIQQKSELKSMELAPAKVQNKIVTTVFVLYPLLASGPNVTDANWASINNYIKQNFGYKLPLVVYKPFVSRIKSVLSGFATSMVEHSESIYKLLRDFDTSTLNKYWNTAMPENSSFSNKWNTYLIQLHKQVNRRAPNGKEGAELVRQMREKVASFAKH